MIDTKHFCSFFLNYISISYITYYTLYVYVIITLEVLVESMLWITLIIIYNYYFFPFWDQNSQCLIMLNGCYVSIMNCCKWFAFLKTPVFLATKIIDIKKIYKKIEGTVPHNHNLA